MAHHPLFINERTGQINKAAVERETMRRARHLSIHPEPLRQELLDANEITMIMARHEQDRWHEARGLPKPKQAPVRMVDSIGPHGPEPKRQWA